MRSAVNWWLRSPNTSNTNNFWYVDNNGNTNNNNANNTYGVCFDFLLNLARQSSVLKAHFLMRYSEIRAVKKGGYDLSIFNIDKFIP